MNLSSIDLFDSQYVSTMYEEQIFLIFFAVILVKLDDDVYHDLL